MRTGFFPPDHKPKIIGIVGSRRRNSTADEILLEEAFFQVYQPGDRIVSGGCSQGADAFAEVLARRHGITIIIHYARWADGKASGLARNTSIARDADVLLAVVASDRTGGTEDTIDKARRFGKKITIL